jgi:S-adenosylmethionine:tRNA-ribosyltransferase-isomerase (queuine synthetase)
MLQIKALLRYFVTMQTVNLSEYTYELPDEKIARYPLQARGYYPGVVEKQDAVRRQVIGQISELQVPDGSLFVN